MLKMQNAAFGNSKMQHAIKTPPEAIVDEVKLIVITYLIKKQWLNKYTFVLVVLL